ncbi:hypothetical protein OG225_07165 [Nocardia sp. NBC_01377]
MCVAHGNAVAVADDGLGVTATDLHSLAVPEQLRIDVSGVVPDSYIHGHTIEVVADWWRAELAVHGLDADGVLGPRISRGELFELATDIDGRDEVLRLLWNVLAWGTGSRARHGRNRIRAVAADPDRAADLLHAAARLSRTDPAGAYAVLRPGDRANAIGFLGPSFFTKFLYFAGGGDPDHPCHILDERVARALRDLGWVSLPPRGWSASAYQRYNDLLRSWTGSAGPARSDMVERWLFGR